MVLVNNITFRGLNMSGMDIATGSIHQRWNPSGSQSGKGGKTPLKRSTTASRQQLQLIKEGERVTSSTCYQCFRTPRAVCTWAMSGCTPSVIQWHASTVCKEKRYTLQI